MKNLFKAVVIAGCILVASGMAKAQSKIGYVNFNSIIDVMPDKVGITTALQSYTKTFSDQLQQMQSTYQTTGAAYEAGRAAMTDAVRTQKEAELTDLQKRIQDYNTKAQQSIEAKQAELANPLFVKVKAAVSAVAKEKLYSYVFDSSQINFLVAPDADDLTAAVKLKLGVK